MSYTKKPLLAVMLISATMLSSCTALRDAFIVVTESVHPEWTNQPPVVVTNDVPPVPTPSPEPPPPVVEQPTGAVITSAKWSKFPMVALKYTGTDGWPTKVVAGKTCIGIMELNGRKVEWFKPGQTSISVKNAINDPKYYQAIPSGSEVTINIADINGKRDSNKITLIWP